eukprot:1154233-Pyramimonas_sp.AAC.1
MCIRDSLLGVPEHEMQIGMRDAVRLATPMHVPKLRSVGGHAPHARAMLHAFGRRAHTDT